jgi:glycosyltransferase involved in cell wall biosynthesis
VGQAVTHCSGVAFEKEVLPLVSILLAFHNGQANLLLAIRSLREQTYSNWELILLNDGSSQYIDHGLLEGQDSRIKLIDGSKRLGLAARLNQGLEIACGQYIARMDADDIAYPERLCAQVEFLEANREIDLLGTGATVFNNRFGPVGKTRTHPTHEEICARPWSGFCLAHPTWMARRAWFLRYRYDARFLKAQDYELLLRAHTTSRYACLSECLLGYRQERLSIGKIFKSRLYVAKACAQYAQSKHAYMFLVKGLSLLVVKCLYDFLIYVLGRMPRHRAAPLAQVEIDQWGELWRKLNLGIAKKCAA